ncbi:MAG: hypothetical protein ACTSWR_06235 [Candidatus Helarchaeota archaeon]
MSDTFFLRVDPRENDEKLEYLSQIVEKVMEIILKSIEQLTMGLEVLEKKIYTIQDRIPEIETQINLLMQKQSQIEQNIPVSPAIAGENKVEQTSTPLGAPNIQPINQPTHAQSPTPRPSPPPASKVNVSPRAALNDELKSLFARMRKK